MARSFLEWVRAARRKYPLRDVAHVTLPHHAVAMMASYVLRPHRAPLATDLEARDPEALDLVLEGARFLGRHWFRAEIEGVEHVPREGAALLVGNHNGGFLTFDTYLTLAAIAEAQGLERAVRPLAHDFVFDDPILRREERRGEAPRHGEREREHLGACPGVEVEELRDGVAPGQDHELLVGADRDDRHDRHAGAQGELHEPHAAAEIDPPAVPEAAEGLDVTPRVDEHEVAPGERGAGWRVARLDRAEHLRPTYLPLPAQTTVAFGPPLHFGRGDADDEGLVRRCADQTIAAMQTLLDRLSQGRTPWLGRTGRRLGA